MTATDLTPPAGPTWTAQGVAALERCLAGNCTESGGEVPAGVFPRPGRNHESTTERGRDTHRRQTHQEAFMCYNPVPCAPNGGRTPCACSCRPPCRCSSTLLLCDATTTTIRVAPTIVDDTVAKLGLVEAFVDLPGSYANLWSGGALTYPADPNPSAGDGIQVYRTAVGRITATPPPNCEGASVKLTVSARVTLHGPGAGQALDGSLRLYRGTTLLAHDNAMPNAPVGHVETLTASDTVTAADLASGNLYVELYLETFHVTRKSWTADQFTITAELNGCAVQFLRTFIIDCDTGAILTHSDTTLDGAPYTPTGQVGRCSATGDSSS
ncbi:hypothetical protein Srufu_004100 [Streptomyces libani subsp. rufus]|nr:hypothetical protein Srufu_004100 [Streptomyces libani subsp. rufus]